MTLLTRRIQLLLIIWLDFCMSSDHCIDEQCMDYGEEAMIFKTSVPAPGFRTAITSSGLNYINSLVVPLLKNELVKLKIPVIQDKADIKVAQVNYKFKNIHVVDAKVGRSSLKPDSNVGLSLEAADISLKVKGDWSYTTWAASDSGSAEIRASGVSIMAGGVLGADEEGRLSLLSTSCQFRVTDVSVKFQGGASWLYNLFNSVVAQKIKAALESQVCDLVHQVKDSVNDAFNSIPVMIPVDSVAKLNYALTSEPRVTSWCLVTDHKGEFLPVSEKSNQDAPFFPSSLPSLPLSSEPHSKMLYLWLTDYVANTAALVHMRAHPLAYTITPDMVDMGSLFTLDTNSFSHVIPELSNFPNQALTLRLRTSEDPPLITITPDEIKLTIPGAVDFFVSDSTGDQLVFTLGIVVSLDIQAWIEARQEDKQLFLKANATFDDAKLSVLASNIGVIGEKAVKNLWNAVSFLCQMFLMPPINRLTNEGFPVPTLEGVTFVDPHLTLGKGYILIETDISYTAPPLI